MNYLYFCEAEVACFANDNDAFVPEHWANEGLMILEANMVMAHLVHRDFENEVQRFGDVVNTRRPNKFKIARKVDGDTLTYQDATSTNVPVKLDQWFVQPFTIYDGEESLSFKDLVEVYLKPAMLSIANGVDRAVTGQIQRFFGTSANRVGRLENFPSSTSNEVVLDARQVLNNNLAPTDMNRHLLLTSASETALLKNDIFVKANERGDGGTALEMAKLGQIYGFNTWMGQNVPSLAAGTSIAGTTTNAHAVGYAGAIATGDLSATVVGEFVNVAGNDQPTYTTAITGSTGDFTLNEALKYATGAGAVITAYTSDTVDHPSAGTYAIGWTKTIEVDNIAYWNVGQLCAFGTGAARRTYTVIEFFDLAAEKLSKLPNAEQRAVLARAKRDDVRVTATLVGEARQVQTTQAIAQLDDALFEGPTADDVKNTLAVPRDKIYNLVALCRSTVKAEDAARALEQIAQELEEIIDHG